MYVSLERSLIVFAMSGTFSTWVKLRRNYSKKSHPNVFISLMLSWRIYPPDLDGIPDFWHSKLDELCQFWCWNWMVCIFRVVKSLFLIGSFHGPYCNVLVAAANGIDPRISIQCLALNSFAGNRRYVEVRWSVSNFRRAAPLESVSQSGLCACYEKQQKASETAYASQTSCLLLIHRKSLSTWEIMRVFVRDD